MTHSVSSESLDHFGIVAGWCQELNLASLINSCVDRRNEHAKVTVGDAAVALILNGFGFVKRSLYMTSQFFKGKPVAQLLGKDIQASDLNDDTLGRALDTIAEYGPEKLFASVAFEIGKSRGLLGKSVHLDTTSISLNGEYDTPEEAGVIRINHGYSKDHRHDLKQFVTIQWEGVDFSLKAGSLPRKRSSSAVETQIPCFLQVEIKLRIRQELLAVSRVL